MGLFGSKSGQLDVVGKISVFPKIGTAVLRKDKHLIIFSPTYLLKKHGETSNEVSSKFMNITNATQLLALIENRVSARDLANAKVEIKELDFGQIVGTNNLVQLSPDLIGVLHQENVRGNMINTILVDKGKIRTTNLLNIILVLFDSQYGQGVEKLFKEKYGGNIGFEQFETVHVIVTMYPGKFAPVMTDSAFWNQHALLKEI
jgi:hypothetical protein